MEWLSVFVTFTIAGLFARSILKKDRRRHMDVQAMHARTIYLFGLFFFFANTPVRSMGYVMISNILIAAGGAIMARAGMVSPKIRRI